MYVLALWGRGIEGVGLYHCLSEASLLLSSLFSVVLVVISDFPFKRKVRNHPLCVLWYFWLFSHFSCFYFLVFPLLVSLRQATTLGGSLPAFGIIDYSSWYLWFVYSLLCTGRCQENQLIIAANYYRPLPAPLRNVHSVFLASLDVCFFFLFN